MVQITLKVLDILASTKEMEQSPGNSGVDKQNRPKKLGKLTNVAIADVGRNLFNMSPHQDVPYRWQGSRNGRTLILRQTANNVNGFLSRTSQFHCLTPHKASSYLMTHMGIGVND